MYKILTYLLIPKNKKNKIFVDNYIGIVVSASPFNIGGIYE